MRSHYGQDGVLRYQSDGRRNQQLHYLYLSGSLVATRATPLAGGSSTIRYQHTDALGSPVAVTDHTRTVTERSEYEPYGHLLNRPISDGPGYTGHVADALSGLSYLQQRYYDPAIGRFLSVDPVTANTVNGANFNRYWYGNNNPYKYVDPDGRLPVLVPVVIFVVKEIASEAVEQVTGVPLPTVKNGVKQVIKKVVKSQTRKASRAAKREKHHVVPQRDRRAAAARDNMRSNGIDPKTEKSNLVDLPGDKHDITKRESYVNSVNDRVSAQDGADEIKLECCQIAKELVTKPVEELDRLYPRK